MDLIEVVSSAMDNLAVQSRLPEDLVFNEILSKVPTKFLIRFKCVSKTWLARISSDSSFIANHINRHSSTAAVAEKAGNIIRARYSNENKVILRMFFLGHDESKLVEIDTSYVWKKSDQEVTCVILPIGACNGLVGLRLFYSDETDVLVLWNPATREVNYLPQTVGTPGSQERQSNYYFGFDNISNDYKIVRLEEIFGEDENEGVMIDVQIFTKSSGCWRHVTCFSGCELLCGRGQGLVVDGVMHWAVETLYEFIPFHILSFDLSKEEFRELEGPLCLHGYEEGDYEDLHIIKWKGSLGAMLIKPERKEVHFWLKTKKTNADKGDGNENCKINFCWKKMSIIDPSLCPVKSSGVLRDQLILSSDCDDGKSFLYDLGSHETSELEEDLGKVYFYDIFDHVHTLVSPN